ncbi:MAG: ribosome maturation factor RimM [Bacillota bacterium]
MEYLRTGLIVRPHGVNGAVKLMPLTHDVARFHKLKEAYIENGAAYEPVAVERVSVQPDAVTLWFAGISTRDEAEKLRGKYLCVDRAHAVELPEGRYFVTDLIGCRVFSGAEELGTLEDVLETGANDVYVVRGKRMLLIPALKKLLTQVDVAQKRILLDPAVLEEVGLFED